MQGLPRPGHVISLLPHSKAVSISQVSSHDYQGMLLLGQPWALKGSPATSGTWLPHPMCVKKDFRNYP